MKRIELESLLIILFDLFKLSLVEKVLKHAPMINHPTLNVFFKYSVVVGSESKQITIYPEKSLRKNWKKKLNQFRRFSIKYAQQKTLNIRLNDRYFRLLAA